MEIFRRDPAVYSLMETTADNSDLTERLRERIGREGPMTFHDWMKVALYDVSKGYYCRSDRKKWGREGDYRTSPERSPLFAATFARYFAKLYDNLGKPSSFTIVEAGGGDGHFAHGVMQTLQNFFPQVFSSTNYVLDELSAHSRSLAWQRLRAYPDRVKFRKLDDVAVVTGVGFSNELLDSFPVHRVKLEGGSLREFYVDRAPKGKFVWRLGDLSTTRLEDYLRESAIQLAEGQVAEVNLEVEDWFKKVAAMLGNGYVVTVDYGGSAQELYSSPTRKAAYLGTLRGFHRHQFVDDVLAHPGDRDLTTTVDWSFVNRMGTKLGLEVAEFERLDKFLLKKGLAEQLESQLQMCQSEAEKLALSTAAREMILPDGMAASFQVLIQKKATPTSAKEETEV